MEFEVAETENDAPTVCAGMVAKLSDGAVALTVKVVVVVAAG